MSDGTKIEWADATANYVNGCSVVSPGCTNCYAMKLAGTRMRSHPTRAGLTADSKAGPVWTGEVRANEAVLREVLGWKRPRRIFWNAHGDLFHENVPDDWIDRAFAVMALTPQHIHMVLTKRPERMRAYFAHDGGFGRWGFIEGRAKQLAMEAGGKALVKSLIGKTLAHLGGGSLPNVWLGTSVEDQVRADERIPHLLETPAAKRFLSCEPLLGAVDLAPVADETYQMLSRWYGPNGFDETGSQPLQNRMRGYFPRLDWVIAGGESGPNARPMHPDWVRGLRDQCAAAGVPFFFKQWGEFAPLEKPHDWDSTDWDNPRRDHLVSHNREHDMNYYRIGKKRAGNLLDGRQHLEFPA